MERCKRSEEGERQKERKIERRSCVAHSKHNEIRRLEGVIRRKEDATVVYTPGKIRVRGALDCEVPLINVVLEKDKKEKERGREERGGRGAGLAC